MGSITAFKNLLRRNPLLVSGLTKEAILLELELPGEPMIYSVKFSLRHRLKTVNFLRDRKWFSVLRCKFRSWATPRLKEVPLVLLLKFYVSPPLTAEVALSRIQSEREPAVLSFELCEYLLSFLEMLRDCLFKVYRQIVKVDMVKFYSARPRTVMQIMTWEEYRAFYCDPVQTCAKEEHKDNGQEDIQSQCEGNGTS